MKVLFLTAPLKERIWGGDYFKKIHRTEKENIGELWSASAHKEGESIIVGGEFNGIKLSQVYTNHPELFNNPTLKEFPILVKLIYAKDPLSVQVHPNDEYALKYENQYGKTEGWLVLDAAEGSTLVLGHNAKNKDELVKYIENDNYDELLKTVPVKPGQFYPIYAGTIHAIGAGITICEIQQTSDTTYRLFDFKRKDKNGNERELHIEQSMVASILEPTDDFYVTPEKVGNELKLVNCPLFNVSRIEVDGSESVEVGKDSFATFTVTEGDGYVQNGTVRIQVGKGTSVFAFADAGKVQFYGRMSVVKSTL